MVHRAECRQTGGAPASCVEIQAMVGAALIGEGYGRNHVCSEDSSGGCSCTFDIVVVNGDAGNWQTTEDGKLLLEPAFMAPEAPPRVPITYCASDTTLSLGPELRTWGPSGIGTDTVFERADCADGVQGVGEDGPDCGRLCSNICL